MKINMLQMVWQNLFHKPATLSGRKKKTGTDKGLRGLITFSPQECVACGLCMKDCPTGAIRVVNLGTKENKDMHAYLDTGLCIFCGQCEDSCAKHCLHCGTKMDLTQTSRQAMEIEL